MKNLIYAGDTNTQLIPSTGGVVNFNSVIRKKGCHLQLSGGNVTTHGEDHYVVLVNLSVSGTGAGTLDVQLFADGVPITGASASITTADATVYQLLVPGVVKESCYCEKTITCFVSGVAVNITNATITVFD